MQAAAYPPPTTRHRRLILVGVLVLRLLGLGLVGLSCYALVLVVLCIVYLATAEQGWRFCYDGPSAEWLVLWALVGGTVFVLGEGAFWLVRRLSPSGPSSKWRRLRRWAIAAPLALALLGGFLLVAGRNFGEWAILKRELQRTEAVVEALVGSTSLPLSAEQHFRIQREITLPTLQLSTFRHPVQLRILGGYPPYVGAHFGEGANARFAPDTMWCTYAD